MLNIETEHRNKNNIGYSKIRELNEKEFAEVFRLFRESFKNEVENEDMIAQYNLVNAKFRWLVRLIPGCIFGITFLLSIFVSFVSGKYTVSLLSFSVAKLFY